jgi:hypothetical protein
MLQKMRIKIIDGIAIIINQKNETIVMRTPLRRYCKNNLIANQAAQWKKSTIEFG